MTGVLRVDITRDNYPPAGIKLGLVYHPDIDDSSLNTPQVPSAVKMQDLPVSNPVYKGRSIPVLLPVWHHIDDINDEEGERYARSIGSLWINIPYKAGETPKCECIISGANIVGYYPSDSTTSHIKLVAYAHDARLDLVSPFRHNWFTEPWLYWECTSVDKDGHSGHVWGDVHCFLPRIQYGNTGLWLLKSKVWFPPEVYQHLHIKNGVEWWDGNTPLVTFENGSRIIHDPKWAGMPASVIAPTEDRSHFISD